LQQLPDDDVPAIVDETEEAVAPYQHPKEEPANPESLEPTPTEVSADTASDG